MGEASRSRPLAIVLSLIPGCGHLYWGKASRGIALFSLFALGGFALLNGYLLFLDGWEGVLRFIGVGLIAAATSWALIDLVLRTRPARLEAEAALRDRLLRQGIVAYLQDELERAEEAFLGILRLDPYDPEAWFRLAVLACRRGAFRSAARRIARLRRCDTARKWEWEIRCEEGRLRTLTRRSREDRESDARLASRQETAEVTV